jgi:hypothetical protein
MIKTWIAWFILHINLYPMKIFKISFFLLFFNLSFGGYAQSVYFPPFGDWEQKKPSDLKVDGNKIQVAIDFAINTESEANKNMKIAHYQSAFGREPFGFPVGPMKDRGGGRRIDCLQRIYHR